MNVNVKLSLTDDERKRLATLIDKKVSKRLATRKEVNEFVTGCIEYAVSSQAQPREPDSPSYMRGWNQVIERLRK